MGGSRWAGRLRTFAFQKRVALVAIVVAVVVAASAIYVAARILEESRERTYQCVYTLVINPAGDDEYSVYVPVPCTWSDSILADDFAQDIIVTGNVVVGVEGTPYGPALKVEGTGRAELNWSSSSSGEDYGYYTNLTMVIDAEPGSLYDKQAWVSSDQEGVSAYLNYSASNLWYPKPWFPSGSDRHYRIVMGSGEVGWRLVECEFEWAVSS